MTEQKPTTKKRPDYLAFVPIQRAGQPPKFAKVGVGFTYRNRSIGLLYDAIPLSGQIVLVGIDDQLPEAVSYGPPTRGADFEANMVRESGNDSFWTEVGSAYRQDGYLSVICPVFPRDGKLVLTQPRDPK
jgi:hypothetical protein